MSAQLEINFAREAGRAAGQACEDKAVRELRMDASAARAYVLRRLEAGPVPGEELVDGLTREGILRGDARASGPLFSRLSKENVIECVRADLPRRNGRGTSGGRLWALVKRLGGCA